MYKTIKITTELRDYIERLQYEVSRYKDLLNSVNKDAFVGTEEEWNDSWNYYQYLYEEAKYKYQFAQESVAEIYKEEIGDEAWCINLNKCEIYVGTNTPKIIIKKEIHNNFISRLFPIDKNSGMVPCRTITFQVTNACNMACTYCFQHHKYNKSMSFETAKKFIDMILDGKEKTKNYMEYNKAQGIIIEFIGGEPWLEIDLITQISDYFINELFRRKHHWAITYKFSLCSNGLLHFEDKVQAYMKKHNQHFSYTISIDGNKELHDSCRVDLLGRGTYDRAIRGVQDYRKKYGHTIGCKMTLVPDNIHKLSEAITDMVNNGGYNRIFLNCASDQPWDITTHPYILYKELNKVTDWLFEHNLQNRISISMFDKKIGKKMSPNNNNNCCGGTGSMLALNSEGDLYPCLRYSPTSIGNKQPAYIIGNVEQGLGNTDEHLDRIKCLKCITRRSQSTDECFYCPINTGCTWCSAYNYETFGTPNKRTTLSCCMHKARVLANMYYWKKMNQEYIVEFPKDWAIEIIGEQEYNNLLTLCQTNEKGE